MESNSFSVVPMGKQIFLNPGEIYSGSITVANLSTSASELSYEVNVSPYSVIGNGYSADFLSTSSHTEITNWITIENPTGIVAPNESKTVNYTITVPEDASPGGQYAALSVIGNPTLSANTGNGLAIGNVYEIASLIYANIAGIIEREGSIIENSVPGFSTVSSVKTTAIIENKGNTHEDAIFSFEITNAINGEVIYSTATNSTPQSEIIMPDTTREITHEFANLPFAGIVKVVQTISYGEETSITEQTLFICPIWLMAVFIAIILGVTGLTIARIKHHHNRKRAIQI